MDLAPIVGAAKLHDALASATVCGMEKKSSRSVPQNTTEAMLMYRPMATPCLLPDLLHPIATFG
jgi:hypothetical protein